MDATCLNYDRIFYKAGTCGEISQNKLDAMEFYNTDVYNKTDVYDKTDATGGWYQKNAIIKSALKYAADATTAVTWNSYLSMYLEGTTSATYDSKIRWTTYGDDKYVWTPPIVAPGVRLRQMIQTRMAPAFHSSRRSMSIAMDIREERARQTLRRIIGDQAYRKFIRNGFITVVPKSGLTYRIYPGCGITDVYERGIIVDRLCVVLEGNFPPTDSLLMRYLLILNDEGEFSKYAVKHHVSQGIKAASMLNSILDRLRNKLVFPQEKIKPLTEAWAQLKVA